jgi:hypothetical protein
MKRKLARLAVIGALSVGMVGGISSAAQASSWHYWWHYSYSSDCASTGSWKVSSGQWQGYECRYNYYYGWAELWGLY